MLLRGNEPLVKLNGIKLLEKPGGPRIALYTNLIAFLKRMLNQGGYTPSLSLSHVYLKHGHIDKFCAALLSNFPRDKRKGSGEAER